MALNGDFVDRRIEHGPEEEAEAPGRNMSRFTRHFLKTFCDDIIKETSKEFGKLSAGGAPKVKEEENVEWEPPPRQPVPHIPDEKALKELAKRDCVIHADLFKLADAGDAPDLFRSYLSASVRRASGDQRGCVHLRRAYESCDPYYSEGLIGELGPCNLCDLSRVNSTSRTVPDAVMATDSIEMARALFTAIPPDYSEEIVRVHYYIILMEWFNRSSYIKPLMNSFRLGHCATAIECLHSIKKMSRSKEFCRPGSWESMCYSVAALLDYHGNANEPMVNYVIISLSITGTRPLATLITHGRVDLTRKLHELGAVKRHHLVKALQEAVIADSQDSWRVLMKAYAIYANMWNRNNPNNHVDPAVINTAFLFHMDGGGRRRPPMERWYYKGSWLNLAAEHASVDMVKLMLPCINEDIDQVDCSKYTPLMTAINNKKMDMCHFFFSHGAGRNGEPWVAAVQAKFPEIFHELSAESIHVGHPLMVAIAAPNREEYVKLIIGFIKKHRKNSGLEWTSHATSALYQALLRRKRQPEIQLRQAAGHLPIDPHYRPLPEAPTLEMLETQKMEIE